MGTVTLTMFWDSQRPSWSIIRERVETRNGACYSEKLRDKLKLTIEVNTKTKQLKCVVLLYDNADSHTADNLLKEWTAKLRDLTTSIT